MKKISIIIPAYNEEESLPFLIKKLEEAGYSRDQIHLESTGNDFRRYFNSIIDLILKVGLYLFFIFERI